MSKGAVLNLIRIKPTDPKQPYTAVVDVEHIIGWKTYAWSKDTAPTTEILLSNGQGFVSNETPEQFEGRLRLIHPNIFIQD